MENKKFSTYGNLKLKSDKKDWSWTAEEELKTLQFNDVQFEQKYILSFPIKNSSTFGQFRSIVVEKLEDFEVNCTYLPRFFLKYKKTAYWFRIV